jgi:hypothetical protein
VGKEVVKIVRIPKNFWFSFAPKFADIGDEDRARLKEMQFHTLDAHGHPLTVGQVKERIRVHFHLQVRLAVWFAGEELADSAEFYLLPNPEGKRAVVHESVQPPFQDGPPRKERRRSRSVKPVRIKAQLAKPARLAMRARPSLPPSERKFKIGMPHITVAKSVDMRKVSLLVSELLQEGGPPLAMRFRVNSHAEFELGFPEDETVKRAKETLAPYLHSDAGLIRVLFRGKAVGDSVVLGRIPLQNGEPLMVGVPGTDDVVLDLPDANPRLPRFVKYSCRDVHWEDASLELEFEVRDDIAEAQRQIAEQLHVKPVQIAVFAGGRKLDSYEAVADVAPDDRLLTFDVTGGPTATYLDLLSRCRTDREYWDDTERQCILEAQAKAMLEVSEEELAKISSVKGDFALEDAVAIYISSGRHLEAIEAAL